MERFVPHRCDAALRKGMPVRWYEGTGWVMLKWEYDRERRMFYPSEVARVSCCPWCGERLVEPCATSASSPG